MNKEKLIAEALETFRESRHEMVEMELSEHLHGAALNSAVEKRLDDMCNHYKEFILENWDNKAHGPKTCCICEREFVGFGNNPEPAMPGEDEAGELTYCCDECNQKVVIPVRLLVTDIIRQRREDVSKKDAIV